MCGKFCNHLSIYGMINGLVEIQSCGMSKEIVAACAGEYYYRGYCAKVLLKSLIQLDGNNLT